MPERLEDFLMIRPPTADRPLLGQTVLVVEDSRFACEALRLICQRSGARIRRADSLRAAGRHLRTYRPGVVLADIGLPDGSGLDLIRRLSRADNRIPVLMVMSGDDTRADEALRAGADVFLSKPITSVGAFQAAILERLPSGFRPARIDTPASDHVCPDRIALRDDLAFASELLGSDPDPETLDYLAAFLSGLARSADDRELGTAARVLARRRAEGHPGRRAGARLRDLVLARIGAEQQV